MTWQPVTQPPQEVGLVRYADKESTTEFRAQWDGRCFRYADGLPDDGEVILPLPGDMWTKEESNVPV